MDSQLSQDSTHAAREGAIHASRGGLKPDRTHSFHEADTLVFIHLFPSDPVDLLVFFCRTRITYHFSSCCAFDVLLPTLRFVNDFGSDSCFL